MLGFHPGERGSIPRRATILRYVSVTQPDRAAPSKRWGWGFDSLQMHQKIYGVVVYVWKGHLILNKKSSVRLPSDATILPSSNIG